MSSWERERNEPPAKRIKWEDEPQLYPFYDTTLPVQTHKEVGWHLPDEFQNAPKARLAHQSPPTREGGTTDKQGICYGTIEDATIINCHGFEGLFDTASSSLEELCLSGQGGSLIVHNVQGSYCGLLCPQFVQILNIITSEHNLRFQIFVNTKDVQDASLKKLNIQINIYGLLHDATKVGEILSDKNVFLQPPLKYDGAYEYQNPQCYVVPSGEQTEIIDTYTKLAAQENLASSSSISKNIAVNNMLMNLLPLENKITRNRNPIISNWLKTTLLAHQIDGLSFMQEKEELLQYRNDDYGGILADQPGLGKSLTALALVAGSTTTQSSINDLEESQSTLIVVPTSLLSSWQEQIKEHFYPRKLRVLIHHGARRKQMGFGENSPHIVLTTYSTLVSDRSQIGSSLYQKHWYRVILDEAHFIKDRSTKRFSATCALNTYRRWCLTGTPVQNRIDDLSALFTFLRRAPLSDYSQFNKRVVQPLSRGDPEGLHTLQTVLPSIMIRRTKEVLVLPPRSDLKVEVPLSSSEKAIYEMAREESKTLINTCIQKQNFTNGVHIIQSILRQRQISNHGLDLLPPSIRALMNRRCRIREATRTIKEEEFPIFCEACNLEIRAIESNTMFEHCFHLICVRCTQVNTSESESTGACPICIELEGGMSKPQPKVESLQAWANDLEYSGPSTKVQALLENIKKSQQETKDSNPVKCIVFSSWVKMLHLVGLALKDADINVIQYDGTLSLNEKQKVLNNFQTNPRIIVLLMSIGSGGVGLNLTAASHVHLMEPQWNPMVEAQALDRVHRLGQKNPVTTFRYIAKSTFDESILLLQNKKLEMAELSLGSNEHSKTEGMQQRLLNLSAVFR